MNETILYLAHYSAPACAKFPFVDACFFLFYTTIALPSYIFIEDNVLFTCKEIFLEAQSVKEIYDIVVITQ